MFSYLLHLFWESSEEKLRKFRVILSIHRAELVKLRRTSSYLTRSFYNYLKNSVNTEDIIDRANDLNYVLKKCNAYEKISIAGSNIIESWELFDQCKERTYKIEESLTIFHTYSNYIEQKEMLDWIKKAPLPLNNNKTENTEIKKLEYEKISDDNIKDFIKSFCKQFNLSYDLKKIKLDKKENFY